LIFIDTGYACAGIVITDNETRKVIKAAPIYRWMVGKTYEEVMRWRKIKKFVEIKEQNRYG